MNNSTRLYRSRRHRVFGGVAGGLADYFNIDVILARLLFVIIFFAGGGGIIIYVVLWIITPEEPLITPPPGNGTPSGGSANSRHTDISDATIVNDGEKRNNNRTFIGGVALILIGFLFLLNTMIPHLVILHFWPLVLIIVGIMLVFNEVRPVNEQNNNQESTKIDNNEI